MAAVSKGQVHDSFTQAVTELATQAQKQSAAARGTGLRPWNVPKKVTDPLDVPGMTAGFDRSEVNANYEEVIGSGQNPGTVGDVVSLMTQCDYIAIRERAFRARHCTPVRLLAMAAARRAGHGDTQGVFTGGVARFAQDVIKAGQE